MRWFPVREGRSEGWRKRAERRRRRFGGTCAQVGEEGRAERVSNARLLERPVGEGGRGEVRSAESTDPKAESGRRPAGGAGGERKVPPSEEASWQLRAVVRKLWRAAAVRRSRE